MENNISKYFFNVQIFFYFNQMICNFGKYKNKQTTIKKIKWNIYHHLLNKKKYAEIFQYPFSSDPSLSLLLLFLLFSSLCSIINFATTHRHTPSLLLLCLCTHPNNKKCIIFVSNYINIYVYLCWCLFMSVCCLC